MFHVVNYDVMPCLFIGFLYMFFCQISSRANKNRIQIEDETHTESDFNPIRGKDSWLGRTIEKDFGAHGKFTGRVDGVDEDAENKGLRVFHVTYCDGDDEWMAVPELASLLLSSTSTVCYYSNLPLNVILTNLFTTYKTDIELFERCSRTCSQKEIKEK